MKFSATIVAAIFAVTAYSQSVSDLVAEIPSCAITCLATGATSVGCGISDYECQCGPDFEKIVSAATPCVLQKCTGDDPIKTLSTTNAICDAVKKGGSDDAGTPTKPDDKPQASVQPSVAPSVQPEPTKTPVEEEPPAFTGAASSIKAGALLAAVGAVAAFAL